METAPSNSRSIQLTPCREKRPTAEHPGKCSSSRYLLWFDPQVSGARTTVPRMLHAAFDLRPEAARWECRWRRGGRPGGNGRTEWSRNPGLWLGWVSVAVFLKGRLVTGSSGTRRSTGWARGAWNIEGHHAWPGATLPEPLWPRGGLAVFQMSSRSWLTRCEDSTLF